MDINELIDYCQAIALQSRLQPDAASIYRKFCRNYSKTFHTPLAQVEHLDPIHVVLTIYEEQLANFNLEDEDDVGRMLELAYMISDPDYQAANEADLDEFVEEAEEEEAARLKAKVPLTKALATKKKVAPEGEKEHSPKELPKTGGINLAYLAESENEG